MAVWTSFANSSDGGAQSGSASGAGAAEAKNSALLKKAGGAGQKDDLHLPRPGYGGFVIYIKIYTIIYTYIYININYIIYMLKYNFEVCLPKGVHLIN